MYDLETTFLLARHSLEDKGLPETEENLMAEMRTIQDGSNIRSRDHLPASPPRRLWEDDFFW